MDRVVADSNIFLSAFLRGGKPQQLLGQAKAGRIELFVSEPLIQEVGRVLRTKFRASEEDVARRETEMRSLATVVAPDEALTAVPADPDDDRIVECAVAARANAIVTGDAHLLSLGSFRGIKIVTVAEFLTRGRAR